MKINTRTFPMETFGKLVAFTTSSPSCPFLVTLVVMSMHNGAEYVRFLNLADLGNNGLVSPSDSTTVGLCIQIFPNLILYTIYSEQHKCSSYQRNYQNTPAKHGFQKIERKRTQNYDVFIIEKKSSNDMSHRFLNSATFISN